MNKITIDYKITCTSCKHYWELWGDGCFGFDINDRINKCPKCGCQILHVVDISTAHYKDYQKDFTEQNNALMIASETACPFKINIELICNICQTECLNTSINTINMYKTMYGEMWVTISAIADCSVCKKPITQNLNYRLVSASQI